MRPECSAVKVFRAATEFLVGRPLAVAELASMAQNPDATWLLLHNALRRKRIAVRFSNNRWRVLDSRSRVRASGKTLFHAVRLLKKRLDEA